MISCACFTYTYTQKHTGTHTGDCHSLVSSACSTHTFGERHQSNTETHSDSHRRLPFIGLFRLIRRLKLKSRVATRPVSRLSAHSSAQPRLHSCSTLQQPQATVTTSGQLLLDVAGSPSMVSLGFLALVSLSWVLFSSFSHPSHPSLSPLSSVPLSPPTAFIPTHTPSVPAATRTMTFPPLTGRAT